MRFTPDRAESVSLPRWHCRWPLHKTPPLHLLTWLLDPGSLTARLQHLSHGEFSVEVLSQRWGSLRQDELHALSLTGRQRALIREVVLTGHGQPWVYARSILPASSLTGRLRHLRHLDNRPLGALLFRYPHLQRDPIELAEFSPSSTMIPAPWRSQHALWGRRSCFYLDQKPLLVSEIFLDDFMATINPDTSLTP